MSWLIGGILFLVLGYFTYGKVVERVFGVGDRETPAVANPDGVDYVPLPKWKNMLIQLLNIAGVGPVLGVILGIKFGKVALLIIPVGCVFMGAVHDFASGIISIRMNGANLPRIVREFLGRRYSSVFSWMMAVLLLLCVTVFINTPASLIDTQWASGVSFFWPAVAIILAYFVIATLFPVDQIIGRVYPIFGALLLVGSFAILGAILYNGHIDPKILDDCAGFDSFKQANPLFPCLFVTIACGIISGFHATQSPIVARTITSERSARATFYGMMIAEGVIAMIWAAAALAMYNLFPEQIAKPGPVVLGNIAIHFLGKWMGGVTVAALIILAITSGDTALRSLRLSIAEECSIKQDSVRNRVATTLPLVAVVIALLAWSNIDNDSFKKVWNYFAWGNQLISATMLMAASVWMLRSGKKYLTAMTLIPGIFMTAIVASYILWASPAKQQPWGIVWKFSNGHFVNCGLPLNWSIALGLVIAVAFAVFVFAQAHLRK